MLKTPLSGRLVKILNDGKTDDVHDQGKIQNFLVHDYLIHDDVANILAQNAAVSPYN